MFKCPFCGAGMAHPKPEEIPMSFKRRAIYDSVAKAGPRGLRKDLVLEKFFPDCSSEVTLRTVIHNINNIIKPQRITTHGGIVRLVVNDQ